jgi:hypothetical protein
MATKTACSYSPSRNLPPEPLHEQRVKPVLERGGGPHRRDPLAERLVAMRGDEGGVTARLPRRPGDEGMPSEPRQRLGERAAPGLAGVGHQVVVLVPLVRVDEFLENEERPLVDG